MFANPYSYTQPFLTLWATASTARRTGYGTESFIDDAAPRSCRNRLVLKHVAEHRPAGIGHRLGHLGFLEFRRANVANNDGPVLPCNSGAFDMQKVAALPGDLALQPPRSALLLSPLEQRQLLLRRPEELRRFNLGSVAQGDQGLQAEVDTNRWTILPLSIRQLDLDIDEPMSLAVAGDVPGLRGAVLGNFSGQPQSVGSSEERQGVAIEFGRALEVGERYPVKIALGRPEARRLGETRSSAVGELRADRVNRVGVNAQFLGHTTAEIGEIESGRTLGIHAGTPAFGCQTIGFCTEVPDEIAGSGLRAKRTAHGLVGIFDPPAVREYHAMGRLSGSTETRSRDRGALPTSPVPTNLPHFCSNSKGARFLPGLKAEVSARNIR